MARETFGVEHVVARIYDPGRAEVYQRLGIPTVATVRWTADQMLRRLLPQGAVPELTDPSGRVVVAEVPRAHGLDRAPAHRDRGRRPAPASPTSPGSARASLPGPDTVYQDGDLRAPRVRPPTTWPRVEHVLDQPPPAALATGRAKGPPLMRVVIAGAGSVGRSIARELLHNGHQVLLIDKDADDVQAGRVPEASWLLADACEIAALHEAGLAECDVVVAATGDDKANLVVSLLAKTEFGVPRTVARVNNPKNEWMFDEAWGVDVAVSTPRLMTALVEEAVSVGDLVRIFQFQQGQRHDGRADPAGRQPVRREARRRHRLARRHGAGRHHPRGPPDRAHPRRLARGRTTSCCSSPRPTSRTTSRRCCRRPTAQPRGRV